MTNMTINQAGLALIKEFEGCKLRAYKDVGGVWTIGFGHVGLEAYNGAVISQEEADELLLDDLVKFEHGVSQYVNVVLTPNQFSALVAFAFNVGLGNFKSSTLLKLLNAGDINAASEQFLRWSKVNGVQVAGLLRRRTAERLLFRS